ncbi:hypothetical protein Barb6XT_00559 [Bacteroidales bacterium Barb6XT]|nr:hypothetical protein Barb6XT_00559 [Bacteroidales bacterium Barb6XT]
MQDTDLDDCSLDTCPDSKEKQARGRIRKAICLFVIPDFFAVPVPSFLQMLLQIYEILP